jgi:hypothetical protein
MFWITSKMVAPIMGTVIQERVLFKTTLEGLNLFAKKSLFCKVYPRERESANPV